MNKCEKAFSTPVSTGETNWGGSRLCSICSGIWLKGGCVVVLLLLNACTTTNTQPDSISTRVSPSLFETFPSDAMGKRVMHKTLSENELLDLQYALADRNLYLTASGDISWLTGKPIMTFQSHRGHWTCPENSKEAVIKATLAGYSGVEIDVMLLRDASWVVHHDKYTGRVTSSRDGGSRRVSEMSQGDWAMLFHRKPGEIDLTWSRPPYAQGIINAWKKHRRPGQKLNIEIKCEADAYCVSTLHDMVRKRLPYDSYVYSSMHIEPLLSIRKLDKRANLAFIYDPQDESIEKFKSDITRAVAGDGLYKQYSGAIEWLKRKETSQRESDGKRRWLHSMDAGGSFGHNISLHDDIRSCVKNPNLIPITIGEHGNKSFVTYSINGDAYHLEQLLIMQKKGMKLPNEAIIDKSVFYYFSRLQPDLIKSGGNYSPKTRWGKLVAGLPNDAAFDRLDEQLLYYPKNRYITNDGSIRRLNQPIQDPYHFDASIDPVKEDVEMNVIKKRIKIAIPE